MHFRQTTTIKYGHIVPLDMDSGIFRTVSFTGSIQLCDSQVSDTTINSVDNLSCDDLRRDRLNTRGICGDDASRQLSVDFYALGIQNKSSPVTGSVP